MPYIFNEIAISIHFYFSEKQIQMPQTKTYIANLISIVIFVSNPSDNFMT